MNSGIRFEDLTERAPYSKDSDEDPEAGGVVVHRCHPDGEAEDFFAFANEITGLKGYTENRVLLYSDPGDGEMIGVTRWEKSVSSKHVRPGSHEDCDVCQGEASDRFFLEEVLESVDGRPDVPKKKIYSRAGGDVAVVYFDSHRMRGWNVFIERHPYVYIKNSGYSGESRTVHSPDDSLEVEIAVEYPERECFL